MTQAVAIDSGPVEVSLDVIVFREDLYPRIVKSPATVQKYAETLEMLPPIEVNQHYEIIDGWNRWTAHRKRGVSTIRVRITQTASDAELLELAIERNAKHGLQLSQQDKQDMARRIYSATPAEKQGPKKQRLADILSVTLRVVQQWLSRIDKDNQEARDAALFNLWLACQPEEEIARAVGMTHQGVSKVLQLGESFRFVATPGILAEIEDEEKRWQEIENQNRAASAHESDFKMSPYNVWKQQHKTEGLDHFGNSEVQWLDNLLYLYTQPFDVVMDPFAGSGSTIDTCKRRLRRYWVADRKPIVEREAEIRRHDIGAGLPHFHLWSKVRLVYLDPPYWKQAAGQYSDDPEDLANMPLDQFHDTLAKVIKGFSKKLKPDAAIALVMQPTQWNAPDRAYTDHVAEMLRRIDLLLDMRYSVPYESQQCNAQMVEWAKANRKCLVLTREIVVWKVG